MQSINRSHILPTLGILFGVWLLLVAIHMAHANEDAPKEGGAEGGAPDAATQKAENADFAAYNKAINKMSQLNGKIDEGQKKIQQLLVQKKMGQTTIKNEKGVQEDILGLITREHKEYIDNREKYNSELREVTYRFPSRGQEIRRQYRPMRPKTVVEIEKELGLDGQLSDLRNKVQEKYQVFNPIQKVVEPIPPPSQKPQGERLPASADNSGRIRLVVPKSEKAEHESADENAEKPAHH